MRVHAMCRAEVPDLANRVLGTAGDAESIFGAATEPPARLVEKARSVASARL